MFNNQILKTIGINTDDIYFINDIIYSAGQTAKEMYNAGSLEVKIKSDADDLVTKADKELNMMLVNAFKKRFPDDGIISEEELADIDKVKKCEKAWIIDPIDGTDNYVKNDGQYSVMIGLLKEGKPLAGWVYSPVMDKLVLGIPGAGVYERISQNPIKNMSVKLSEYNANKRVRIMIGRRDRKSNPSLKEKLSSFEFVEMGSLGLKVMLILEGKADIFIHSIHKLKLWDTVGPSAIAIAGNLHLSTIENNRFIFDINELQHKQTYAVGVPWAFEEVQKTLKGN